MFMWEPMSVNLFLYYICFSDLACDVLFFFFFSSRRRHTRSDRDWSSDVCSSDLPTVSTRIDDPRSAVLVEHRLRGLLILRDQSGPGLRDQLVRCCECRRRRGPQIGRASCRERV